MTAQSNVPTTVLFHQLLNDTKSCPELLLNNVTCQYTADGLYITGKDNTVMLNRYYSLGERLIRYHVKLSGDAKAVFQSNTGDFKAYIDIPAKTISVETNPVVWKKLDFITPEHEYMIEIYRIYQTAKVRIIDVFTGESDEITVTNDGQGGAGTGAVNAGFRVGCQWDYYCFGLQSGTSMLVKQLSVLSLKCNLTVLMYGDSITEPEGYFPTNDFSQSWTQLILNHVDGKAMSGGRSGTTIVQLLERIRNELPYVKAKYVMVTIGTNGGNTEENLSELMEYILAQGSVPILNNIPCNEHESQIEANRLIEKIRQKYGINGCRFDLATSLNHDGKEVDKTTQWHEDWDFGQYYHHPNVKGSQQMFVRTLLDIPEIYE
jgi:hypothetical protein